MWPLLAVVVALAAPEGKHMRAAPPACQARFERARDELIERGFAPTSDKDTRRWLQVEADHGTVRLMLQMRTSADGPATFYSLDVSHPRRAGAPARWRLHRRKYCCDEHASAEDRLFEHRWTRATDRLAATVSVVEFEDALNDADSKRWRDLFVEVGRRAADDCLAIP